MFRKLFGGGLSIGEIQAQHYQQAQECLNRAMSTNDGARAGRLWGEFTQHMDDAGYRGASSYPPEIHQQVTKFLNGNYDPLRESQSSSLTRSVPQEIRAQEQQPGGYYREEVIEETGGWFRRRRVIREERR